MSLLLLILLVVLPLVPLFMALVGVTTGRRMRRQYETLARMSGHFLDLVSGLTTLRVYGRADQQVATVRRATESYRRHTMATLRTAFLSGLILDLIATLSYCAWLEHIDQHCRFRTSASTNSRWVHRNLVQVLERSQLAATLCDRVARRWSAPGR